ncbi:MAG: LPXTG cell wall anchor domain-containing protein, partial [Limosilactobacillus mucosae]
TINYVDEDGNKVNGAPDGTSSYVQTAEFTRTAIVDKVTGKILGYDTDNDGKVDTENANRAWTPIEKTLETVKSADPSSVGYDKVDTANVSPLVVTPDQGDKTVTVTYSNNPVSGTIKYIDDTTGVELDSDNLPSGKIGSTINYKTADKIKAYEDQGYELVSNDFTDGSQVYKKTGNDFVVRLKHKTQTLTPNDPNPVTPGQPINPNNPNSPVYPTGVDHKNLAKNATQTIHYIGAGDKTPADNVVTQKDAFTRTVTIDKVTGKILTITPWSTKTFNTVNTPVVNGYHADKKVAGGLTATVDNPNVEETVTYAPNGKLIPVDPNGTPIPGANTPTYTTDPNDPTKVLNPTVPSIDGWQPKDKRPGDSVMPKDPGRDTPVPYDQVVSGTIKYIDDTTGKELSSENLEKGIVGSKINYFTKDRIKDYEDHGYELVSNDFNDGKQTYAKEGNDFIVHLKHATKEKVSYKDATQTIHYTGAGSDTPADKVQTEKHAFSKTDTIDKVTGEVTKTTGWIGTKTFGTEDTPVINGYHADKKVAGGLMATVDNPNVEDTVNYAPNGKLIPVDPNGKPIPGADTPTYTTNPTNPTKVLNPTVPSIDDWQPKDKRPGDSVVPTNPGKDTPVVYVKKRQKPVMPVIPEQPRTPNQPDNSKQPTIPTTPDQPNDSIVPNDSKHLATSTPREQLISPVPGNSTQRATVSNSVTAERSAAADSEKETTLPQTGNDKNQAEAAMGLGLTSLSTIMAMLGLKKRRHN